MMNQKIFITIFLFQALILTPAMPVLSSDYFSEREPSEEFDISDFKVCHSRTLGYIFCSIACIPLLDSEHALLPLYDIPNKIPECIIADLRECGQYFYRALIEGFEESDS